MIGVGNGNQNIAEFRVGKDEYETDGLWTKLAEEHVAVFSRTISNIDPSGMLYDYRTN